MNIVKFGDVVKRVNINVDRFNTERLYYVGKGGSIEPNALEVYPKALIKGATIGFKFHFGFDPGHILFMSRCFDQHKAATATFAGVCSDSTYVVETKDESVLLQRYLQLVMQSDHFWDWCEKHKSGGVNYLINYSTLNTYEFPLPPLSEQKRLAEKLWAAYEVKQSYINMIAATEEMVKSQFVEMFGNPLAPIQKHPLEKLGECCVLNPRRPSISLSDTDKVSFVPMPSVSENGYLQDVADEEYGKVKKGFTYFIDNDVLFAKITPCMENGKGAIAQELTNNIGMGSTEFHVLRPIEGKSNAYWLLALTRMPIFRERAAKNMSGTGGQKRVGAAYLENFMVGLPPIDLQEKFASIYRQADKSVFELKKSIAAIDGVIRSLINENL